MTRDITELRPDFAADISTLVSFACDRLEIDLRPTSTFRTFEEQAQLYAQGRTSPGKIVTNAPPGYSWHNYRQATDFGIWLPDETVTWEGPWGKLHDFAEGELGFADRIPRELCHFHKTFGLTLADLIESRRVICQVCAGAGRIPCPKCKGKL